MKRFHIAPPMRVDARHIREIRVLREDQRECVRIVRVPPIEKLAQRLRDRGSIFLFVATAGALSCRGRNGRRRNDK
jgi:hypothetical protein